METIPYAIVPCTDGPIGYRVKRYRERAETLRIVADEILTESVRKIIIKEQMAEDAARAH